MEPLHPKIGPQVFVLDGVEPDKVSPRVVAFSRQALQHIWEALHDLQASCVPMVPDERAAILADPAQPWIDVVMADIERVTRELHDLERATAQDQQLREPRAAYQLALLRQAIGFALQAMERATSAVGGMVRDDFR